MHTAQPATTSNTSRTASFSLTRRRASTKPRAT